jgi:hypothetical protein
MKALLFLSVMLPASLLSGPAWAADSFESAVKLAQPTIHTAEGGKLALIEIPLTNLSGLTITAWSYSVQVRYPDGSTRVAGPMVLDSVSSLLKGNERDSFLPGTTRNLTATVPLDDAGEPPLTANAALRVIALADKSAIGDSTEIGQLASSRRSMAGRMSEVLAEIEKARQSPNPRAEMEALAKRYPGAIVRQLVPLVDNPTAIDAALSGYREYRDLLNQHSALNQQAFSPAK